VRNLRLLGLIASCLFFAGMCDSAFPSAREHVLLEWNVPITPPEGSHLNWYEVKADPEDANNLIVCGAMRNARDNAYYGVLYSSHDGGRSWREVLEDRGSTWVSEQSCAFGDQHIAYFVSEASEVIDGELHHDRGTTRIFVSRDGGETWVETVKTGWADFSSSVVARAGASDARELYVFYNGYSSSNSVKGLGSTLDFFTVSEDGARVSQRQTVPGMAERGYKGVFPSSSVTLNDGTPITLYAAGTQTNARNSTMRTELGVVRFPVGGPSAPIIVATPSPTTGPPACFASLSNSLAYDRVNDRLFVAYSDFTLGHCAIMLVNSSDGGRTWSRSHELRAAESHPSMYFPVLAVNQDGVIGLMWNGKPEGSPDCWFFSISSDGLNLEDTVPLSRCINAHSLAQQSSAYLATVISQPKVGGAASVELLTLRDYLTRVGITSTRDGVFHPLWSTVGDGFGELRTARVRIGQRPQVAELGPHSPPVLKDVTDRIIVLYGGEQRLDHESNSVMLDLSFRNKSSTTIHGPIYMKVDNAVSDYGKIEPINSGPPTPLGAEYLEVSSCLRRESLAPGESTLPYRLTIRFANEDSAVLNRYLILKLNLRLFLREEP